jgi:hypothetical protein
MLDMVKPRQGNTFTPVETLAFSQFPQQQRELRLNPITPLFSRTRRPLQIP